MGLKANQQATAETGPRGERIGSVEPARIEVWMSAVALEQFPRSGNQTGSVGFSDDPARAEER